MLPDLTTKFEEQIELASLFDMKTSFQAAVPSVSMISEGIWSILSAIHEHLLESQCLLRAVVLLRERQVALAASLQDRIKVAEFFSADWEFQNHIEKQGCSSKRFA